MFGNPVEYRQLNSGAHRKRATNFEAPALIWHVAFWNPQGQPKSYAHLKETIDSFILDLCRTLIKDDHVSGLEVSPGSSKTDNIILFDAVASKKTLDVKKNPKLTGRENDVRESDYRVVSIKYSWYGVTFTVRVEIHTEFFSITTFAELSERATAEFLGLGVKLSDLEKLLKRPAPDPTATESSAAAEKVRIDTEGARLSTFLYEKFWDLLSQRIFSRSSMQQYPDNSVFSRIFADFRGLVLSDDFVQFKLADKDGSEASWGHEAEHQFRPLVTATEKYEYTTSYMLDKRAMYMTALGPQPPEDNDNCRIPLTYLLYAHQTANVAAQRPINRWQLGRLVDRIHLLGTVRLAALRDFGALRDAGHELSKLDPFVRTARESVAAHRRSKSQTDAIVSIEKAHDHFNEITIRFNKTAELAKGIETAELAKGILYRVERSRYYYKQFVDNLSGLRLSRVEGCQQYDEFVQRRLGAVYDFIGRLGVRYERAVNTLSSLDENYLAIRANRIAIDVKEIQRYADFALIGALLPYYVIGILSHALHEETPDEKTLITKLTVVVSVPLLATAVYRFIEASLPLKAIGAFAAFVVATLVWILVLVGPNHRLTEVPSLLREQMFPSLPNPTQIKPETHQ